MATITKTLVETGAASTWTVTATAKDIVLTADTQLSREYCATLVGKYSPYSGKNGALTFAYVVYKANSRYGPFQLGYERQGDTENSFSLSANVNYTFPIKSSSYSNITVGDFFSSNNPTERRVPINLYVGPLDLMSGKLYSGGGFEYPIGEYYSSGETNWGVISYLVLDAPPTFDESGLSINTSSAYTGITTASVTVSNLSAKYGGTISDVTLTIGSQTVSLSGAGTLSILLNNVGTFTPTVTVTDSRGQTTTVTYSPLTVNEYTPPTVSFDVERTDSTGAPDDEGTYGLIEATLTFADVIADAVIPSVVLTDDAGTQTTPTVTWYTDNTLTTPVTWSSLSSGDTVYGIFSGLSTQHSYQVSVRPRDSQGTGTAVTQTIGAAFYTVDFLAGGHGIAFGQPAGQTGFFCNMAAHFVDNADVMRALFDFVYPIGSYYETSDTAFDPNVTWGGTWELETQGQVHISSGANYSVSGALTNTTDGGSSTVTLTINEMPSHTHKGMYSGGSGQNAGMAGVATNYWYSNGYLENTGGGQPHNNMQPYIIVNRWHRTA